MALTSRTNKPSPITEQDYGQAENLGVSSRFAREDHTHGTVDATDILALLEGASPIFAGLTIRGLLQAYGMTTVVKIADYTVLSTEWGTFFEFNVGANSATITLPTWDATNIGYRIGWKHLGAGEMIAMPQGSNRIEHASVTKYRSTTANHLASRQGAFCVGQVVSATQMDIVARYGSWEGVG